MEFQRYEDVASVKLIGYTTPTRELQQLFYWDGDHVDKIDVETFIAYCARVSNPAGQLAEERDDRRLIQFLVDHKHWSPLEMANAVLEINTTRDIGRQILRHRTASFQEFSQRYAKVVADDEKRGLQFVVREARTQDLKNRQNSNELTDDEQWIQDQWIEKQEKIIRHAYYDYQWAINNGVAKEQARVILPEGNTMTRMYMNATLRTWVHFVALRTGNGTQKENMMIARACAEAISKVFPAIDDFTQK